MPSREALPVGSLTGVLDAHDWRIDSTLVGSPAVVGDTLYTPQHIEVVGALAVRRDDENRHDPSAEASGEMKRANSNSLVAGFSMIEAMATLALTATIIMALSSVAGQWLPNWRRGFVDLQRADLLGVGLERLVDDLSAAEYVTPSAGVPAPLFEGDASSVTFVRSAIGPDAYPHLEVVRLAEIKEDRGLADGAHTSALRADGAETSGARAPAIAFGDPVTLIRAPFHISFSYAGPDRLWLPSWKGRRELPEAVRISVRDTVANRVLAASTVARIRVTAPGAPKLQAQANAGGALPQRDSRRRTAPLPRQDSRRCRNEGSRDIGDRIRHARGGRLRPRRGALDPRCSCDARLDLFFLHRQYCRDVARGRRPRAGGGLDPGRRRNGRLPPTRASREGETGSRRLRHPRGAHWRRRSLSLRIGEDRSQRRARSTC